MIDPFGSTQGTERNSHYWPDAYDADINMMIMRAMSQQLHSYFTSCNQLTQNMDSANPTLLDWNTNSENLEANPEQQV